jgi:hypothetical protein
LTGLSPELFLNAFLEEFLVARFTDQRSGEAEPFLLSFTLRDAATAQRLAGWVKERLTVPDGRDQLEVEVFELPTSGFKVRAAWLSGTANYAAFQKKISVRSCPESAFAL